MAEHNAAFPVFLFKVPWVPEKVLDAKEKGKISS
jgi:hypothetical protein